MDTTIALVLGTARKGRQSENVARFLEKKLNAQENTKAVLVDVREHLTEAVTARLGKEDERTESTWKDIVVAADGFLFVLPEYNRGYPGEWKLLMDSLFSEYKNKPAHVVGVSSGAFGGARVVDHVKPVLSEMGFLLPKGSLHFANVAEAFDQEGQLTDEAQGERVEKFLATFVERVSSLKNCTL